MCRRGTLELDILLERWLERGYRGSSAADRERFHRLLSLEDDRLQAILLRGEGLEPDLTDFAELTAAIRRCPPAAAPRQA